MFKIVNTIGFLLVVALINVNSFTLVPPGGVKIWENRIIPIQISGTFSPSELKNINSTIDLFNEKTCIKIIPYTNEEDFVVIQNTPTGCWTVVGRLGGKQYINLENPKCTEKPEIFHHKLMHLLGFDHDESVEDDHFNEAEELNDDDIEQISDLYNCNE